MARRRQVLIAALLATALAVLVVLGLASNHSGSVGRRAPALLAEHLAGPHVTLDGRHLMDGAIANNTPISTALKLGATRVIVLPTGMSCALEKPPGGAVAFALHALNLLVMRQLLSDIERFSDRAELAVVPPLCPVTASAYDFSQTADLIRRAEATTRLWLRKKGLEREGAPDELLPHEHENHA